MTWDKPYVKNVRKRIYVHPLVDTVRLFHNRVKSKYGSDFEHTQKDYEEFLQILGPVPKWIKKPECGRLDHSKGYVYDTERKRWNFEWQEARENRMDGSRKGGLGNNVIKTCPHCGLTSSGPVMNRWHFDRCKYV